MDLLKDLLSLARKVNQANRLRRHLIKPPLPLNCCKLADVANESDSQFGNKISDALETLAKEHQLHSILTNIEKNSTSASIMTY